MLPVNPRFEELDWQRTPMGAISLRRRRDPLMDVEVYEVKLDDEFLMSSLFTVAETELARLALAQVSGRKLDVVVGGLGLGYTARAVLQDPRVRALTVVETLNQVIGWHRRRLLPQAAELTDDPRCRLLHDDFFAILARGRSFDPDKPGCRFHAIAVDIDHSPRHVLHPSHALLYRPEGLRRLIEHLHPGGAFALWSNDPPDDDFTATLTQVFDFCRAHVVAFDNPIQGGQSTNTVYIATRS